MQQNVPVLSILFLAVKSLILLALCSLFDLQLKNSFSLFLVTERRVRSVPPYPLLSSETSLKPTRETSVVSALRAHSAGRQSGRQAVSLVRGQGSVTGLFALKMTQFRADHWSTIGWEIHPRQCPNLMAIY